MNPTTPWEARFDLFWGLAPEGTLKYQKGEATKAFIRSLLLAQREEMKKGLEDLRKHEDNRAGLSELDLTYERERAFNQGLDAAIAVVERV